MTLGVAVGVLRRCGVDVEEVVAHTGHALAEADAETPEAVRVESLHEKAAGKDGEAHARSLRPALEEGKGLLGAAVQGVVAWPVSKTTLELRGHEETDAGLRSGVDEVELFRSRDRG